MRFLVFLPLVYFGQLRKFFLWTMVFQVHWGVARHFNTAVAAVLLSRLDLQHMFLKQFSKQHFSSRSPFIYINAEISLETYNNQDKSWAIYPSHFMLVTKIYSTSVSPMLTQNGFYTTFDGLGCTIFNVLNNKKKWENELAQIFQALFTLC